MAGEKGGGVIETEPTLADVDHERHPARGEFECPKCIEHIRRFEAALEDLHGAEREARRLRRRVATLEKEIKGDDNVDDGHSELAREIFGLWNEQVKGGRAREFKGKRRDNVLARLDAGWTLIDFKWAIYGAKKRANSRAGVVYNDLELIARDASTMQSFIDRGKAARAEELARDAQS